MSAQTSPHSPEKEALCPVPECRNGYVRVAVVVQRVHYGSTETFARMDDIECDECGGLGRVPEPLYSPGEHRQDGTS